MGGRFRSGWRSGFSLPFCPPSRQGSLTHAFGSWAVGPYKTDLEYVNIASRRNRH